MRQPSQHPSRQQAGAAGPALELELDLNIELDLDGPATPPAQPAAPAAAPSDQIQTGSPAVSAAASAPSGIGEFSMDLDLDDNDRQSNRGAASAPTSDPEPSSSAGLALSDDEPRQPTPAASGAQTNNELEIRHDELVALAAYPERPDSLPACASYAWGVFKRHRQLQREIAAKTTGFEQLERGVRSQYAEIADSARARMPNQLEPYFTEVDEADSTVSERRANIQADDSSYADEDAALSARLKTLSLDRGPLEQAVKAAKIEFEGAKDQHRRAEMEHKRAAAQLNAAMAAAREAAAEGARFAPPEHAKRIQKHQVMADSHKRQLETRNQTLKAATSKLQEKQKDVRNNDRAVDSTNRERQSLDKKARKAKDSAMIELRNAESKRLIAVEHALRSIETEQAGALSPAELSKMTELDELRDSAREALDLLTEALGTYDDDAAKKGGALVIGGIVLLIAIVVMLATA